MTALDAKWAAALGGRSFGTGSARHTPSPSSFTPSSPAVRTAAAAPPDETRSGAIGLGIADIGGPVSLDLGKLVDGRLLIQGVSGAGKSWTLRRLLEQTAGLVPQVVVDPEGEFRSLAEHFGHLMLDGHRLDGAALDLAARRVREHRLSVLLDLSELDRERQMMAVAAFFGALIEAPRAHWHPTLVAVDEAHLFAPFGGQSAAATAVRKAAIAAVTDLMSRGRKRGLTGVLATQRLARLAKSVVSEVHNFLVGLNTLDLDIRRAAETIGWDARRAFDRLPMLAPGDFVAVGPAFSRSPAVLRIGAVTTRHRGATPALLPPAAIDAGDAARLLDLDELMEASAAEEGARREAARPDGLNAVRALLRDPAFGAAGRARDALAEIAADGAPLGDLARHLALPSDALGDALALLDRFGAVEFHGAGATRAVRLAADMLPERRDP